MPCCNLNGYSICQSGTVFNLKDRIINTFVVQVRPPCEEPGCASNLDKLGAPSESSVILNHPDIKLITLVVKILISSFKNKLAQFPLINYITLDRINPDRLIIYRTDNNCKSINRPFSGRIICTYYYFNTIFNIIIRIGMHGQ